MAELRGSGIDVEVHADKEIPREQLEAARREIATIDRFTELPILGARLTVRRGPGRSKRPFVADASLLLNGRLLAAHTSGPTPHKAAEAAAERLRRQVRRVVGQGVALRNEPRVIEAALAALEPEGQHRPEALAKPREEREIVWRRTEADKPLDTLDAVAELLDLDLEFLLFRHVRTLEDVVVYRHDDGRIGLIHPQGSELATERDVVPEPSRYPNPLTLDEARAEMDRRNNRFLYFVDADDGRGKVIYLRHDGDYGLVEWS